MWFEWFHLSGSQAWHKLFRFRAEYLDFLFVKGGVLSFVPSSGYVTSTKIGFW